MKRKIFFVTLTALVFTITLCSVSFGSSWWDDTVNIFSGFWEGTQEFFNHGWERVKSWWDGSEAQEIKELKQEVRELNSKIDALTQSLNSKASVDLTLSHHELEKELSSRRKELESLEAELNARTLSQDKRQSELDNREAELMQQHQDSKQVLQAQAKNIYARLANNEQVRSFLEADMLDKIDSVNFRLYDRGYGGANESDTPYGNLTVCLDPDKFGFVNDIVLKSALKSLVQTNVISIRRNSAALLLREEMNAAWNKVLNEISSESFFSLENIISGLSPKSGSRDKIGNNIAFFLSGGDTKQFLRFFFRTGCESLYAMAVLQVNGQGVPSLYLASDRKLINKRNLQRELRRNTELNRLGDEVTFYLTSPDNNIDAYLDIFISGLIWNMSDFREAP